MQRASTTLAKWGTSLAVRIPKAILKKAQLKAGDALELEIHDDCTILIQAVSKKLSLDELLAGITPDNCYPETDTGAPVGKEVW